MRPRQRADPVLDRTRARHRLSNFLLRHGEVFRSGNQWTVTHYSWLRQRSLGPRTDFDLLALPLCCARLHRGSPSCAVEDDLVPYFCDGPFAEAVGRLSAYRGVTEMGALVLSAEVCDWRRFPRATTLMGFSVSCRASTRAESGQLGAGSPRPATHTFAFSSSSPPGLISTARLSDQS